MDRIEAEDDREWLDDDWLDYTLDQRLWERLAGLFSGIAIGVLTAIFVIGPGVGNRLFWEAPWYIFFAVILGLLVVVQLRTILVLKGR